MPDIYVHVVFIRLSSISISFLTFEGELALSFIYVCGMMSEEKPAKSSISRSCVL
tara:strand:- start:401 stop:565 length:165 start_codon:yes stop_codon:yes gene_type:complete